MQTIPDAVLDRILEHRPHFAPMIANLRANPDRAAQIEIGIAQAYLAGETRLSASETWYLAQVAYGGPWGGEWCRLVEASEITGYDESHLRRLIGVGQLDATKRGKTWYVRRSALSDRRAPPYQPPA